MGVLGRYGGPAHSRPERLRALPLAAHSHGSVVGLDPAVFVYQDDLVLLEVAARSGRQAPPRAVERLQTQPARTALRPLDPGRDPR